MLVDDFFDDPAFAPILARDLRDGHHRNTTDNPRRFTTAYFHRPEEFAAEVAAVFENVDVLAVEGPCWLAAGSRVNFAAVWSDPARRAALLDLARRVERDPMALASSPHLLAVARRPQ